MDSALAPAAPDGNRADLRRDYERHDSALAQTLKGELQAAGFVIP
jgi:hypothetical protein